MPENLRLMADQIAHSLPFMVAAAKGGRPMLNTTRVLEAVIIAAVLGAGAWLLLVPKLELQFHYMQRELQGLADGQKALRDDVQQLKVDVAVERGRRTAPAP